MYNYPAGAYYDSSAPFNEIPNKDIEVDCEVVMSLRKNIAITTDNYINDGGVIEVLDTVPVIEDMITMQHKPLTSLLGELEKYIRGELLGDITSSRRRELEAMLDDCQGWQEEYIEIEDYKAEP